MLTILRQENQIFRMKSRKMNNLSVINCRLIICNVFVITLVCKKNLYPNPGREGRLYQCKIRHHTKAT